VAFLAEFAQAIATAFPHCPPGRAQSIARHAAARGSGRVGRSAAARAFDPTAVEMAVVASIRHQDTDYDELLMAGVPRADARRSVRADIDAVLARWRD
jgi:hypothetical protein